MLWWQRLPCFENGKAAVISGLDNEQGLGAGTTELHVFRPIHPDIHPAYIYIFLRSPFFAVKGEQSMTGTAGQKRLPTEYFATRALLLKISSRLSRSKFHVMFVTFCRIDRKCRSHDLRYASVGFLLDLPQHLPFIVAYAHGYDVVTWTFPHSFHPLNFLLCAARIKGA